MIAAVAGSLSGMPHEGHSMSRRRQRNQVVRSHEGRLLHLLHQARRSAARTDHGTERQIEVADRDRAVSSEDAES